MIGLGYDGVIRRRVRKSAVLATAAGRAVVKGRRPSIVRGYWWADIPNFGDLVTPWMLSEAGYMPFLDHQTKAQVAGCGSILEHLRADFTGAVWGSGSMMGKPIDLPEATIVAVRGPHSADLVGGRVTTFGDPGLLIARHVRRRSATTRVAFIPHHQHRDAGSFNGFLAAHGQEVDVIDVKWSPRRVASRIARAQIVVSSSLHGMIFADSLGVPVLRALTSNELSGGDFKFTDYEAVLAPDPRWHVVDETTSLEDLERWAKPVDAATVTRVQRDLLGCLEPAVASGRSARP